MVPVSVRRTADYALTVLMNFAGKRLRQTVLQAFLSLTAQGQSVENATPNSQSPFSTKIQHVLTTPTQGPTYICGSHGSKTMLLPTLRVMTPWHTVTAISKKPTAFIFKVGRSRFLWNAVNHLMDYQYTVLPNVAIKFRIREIVRSNLGQKVKSFLHTALSLGASASN
jgi:hypothetical protein